MHVRRDEERILISQPVEGAYILPEIGVMKLTEIDGQEMIEANIGSYGGCPAVKNGYLSYHLSQCLIGICKIINKPMQADTLHKVVRPGFVLLRIQFSLNIISAEISHDQLGVFS